MGIEVKKPDTKKNTSKLQDYNLRAIIEAEGFSTVAASVEDVEEFLEFIENEYKLNFEFI